MVKIDKELNEMEENIIKMGNKVILMHTAVMDVLEHPDKEKELEIIQSDDRINHLEEEINDQAITSLALLSPVASDLRKVIAAIKIASELERIGDYAKNIAIFMIKHEELDENIREYARSMEKEFIAMLENAITCYMNADVEAAFEIPEQDKQINTLLKETKHNVTKQQEEALLEHVFEISSMLRNIERAGDHVKNICEHVIYMVKGQHYDFG
ncbi:phosphate signaling complex protein PhoU [Absiella sp. AM29-15]|uniref:phosphate signaling complex protein PhoU n=1 Tax=Absiella sp. AM29-15 TaxID=2292278 RepID=UPI000E3FDE50|nr:phosphate signaling complex protein PhoU [Absiella sp. AM29-15]RGC52605.1 phosphate transport system regulatory protein PhoU [Absiella sp. AM29-15]